MQRLILLLLLGLSLSPLAQAQRWEFGMGFGGAMYKGDLAPTFNPIYIKPGIEGFLKYNPSYATSFRFHALYTGVRANGADSPDPYVSQLMPNSFNTPIFEVGAGLEYNFLPYRDPLQKRLRGTPYLYGGFAFFYFQPGDVEGLQTRSFQPVIPFGFGYKYRLDKNFNIAAEFGARMTFTDKLDDVSGNDARTGWQRGWRFTNDWYSFVSIKLSYTIYSIICPFDYNIR